MKFINVYQRTNSNLSSNRISSLIITLYTGLHIHIRVPTPLPHTILPHTNNRQKPNNPTITVRVSRSTLPPIPNSQSQEEQVRKKRNSPKHKRQPRHNRPQGLTTSTPPPHSPHNTNNKQHEPKHRVDDIQCHVRFQTGPFAQFVMVGC